MRVFKIVNITIPAVKHKRESVLQAPMVPLKIFCQEDHLGESNVVGFKDTFRCTSFVHSWRLELIQNRHHNPDILLWNCTQKTITYDIFGRKGVRGKYFEVFTCVLARP